MTDSDNFDLIGGRTLCWQKGKVLVRVAYDFSKSRNLIESIDVSLRSPGKDELPGYQVIDSGRTVQDASRTLSRFEENECEFEIRPLKIGDLHLQFTLHFHNVARNEDKPIPVSIEHLGADNSDCGLDDYIVRNKYLDAIEDKLSSENTPLVWVYGLPGFGKTVLAYQLHARLKDSLPVTGSSVYINLEDTELLWSRRQLFFYIAQKTNFNGLGTSIPDKELRIYPSVALNKLLDNNYLLIDHFSSLFENPCEQYLRYRSEELRDVVFELMALAATKGFKVVVFDTMPFARRLEMYDLRLEQDDYWKTNVTEIEIKKFTENETGDFVRNNFLDGYPGYHFANSARLKEFHKNVGGIPKLIGEGLRHTDWLYKFSSRPVSLIKSINIESEKIQESVKMLIQAYKASHLLPIDLQRSFRKVCKLEGDWWPNSIVAPISKKDAQRLAKLGLIEKKIGRPETYCSIRAFKGFECD